MRSILEIFGWLAILGGAVLTVRALLLNTHLKSDEQTPGRRPSVGLTTEGKHTLLKGILLLILGHILKDVLPSFVDQLPGA
jgi:hypothetical protein